MPARRVSEMGIDGSFSTDTRGRGKDGKEKETFGCPYPGCGQSYSRMEYLKRHQRKHQDVRPFVCKDCSKSFARSDVLLRHRRRCHPTPPPADRSSRSPVPPHRAYPGVPVSSSRDDGEANGSSYRGRKHARPNSLGEQDGNPSQRRRGNDEIEEIDRDGEDGQFRQNGMGNGGVYGSISDYYGGTNEPSYTPHLLPMFQQVTPFAQTNSYNRDDPNNLEDASVLLSMAFGSGSSQDKSGQQDDTWGPPNLNMMMNTDGKDVSRQGTSSTSDANGLSNGITPPADANDVSANFLPAMNWLGTTKTGSTPSEGANSWPSSNDISPEAAPSPFNFSKLFSPSAFGIITPPAENTDQGVPLTEQETNQAVMRILDQINRQHQQPQTIDNPNPNPERPLLRLWHNEVMQKAGPEAEIDCKFHLPADRFAGCYQVPHWGVPPIRALSLMAQRTFDTILQHFSFVHTPTFKLTDTSACLAFAICTVGGVRSGKQKWDSYFGNSDWGNVMGVSKPDTVALDGPVHPETTWESMYKRNFKPNGVDDIEVKSIATWENGHIVRNDKTNMLIKSFSQAQGVLMTEYNVALLQALVLYHSPYFLSEAEDERAMANMFLGTIVSITRQIGFFNKDLEHFQTSIQYPGENYTVNELDLCWRKWIQLETRRRTAYLVYHLDLVSALESNIPCILNPCEISLMPLPAPDSLWKAATAEEWFKAVKKHQPMTLDEAMRRSFFLPTYGSFDTLHAQADTKYYCILNATEMGPFARVSMITTILRGIIDVGEGKRDRGDWRDLTDLWINCTWLRPGKKCLDKTGMDLGEVTEASLRDRFTRALQSWREGWDFDPSCPNPAAHVAAPSNSSNASPQSTTSPGSNASADTSEKKLNYCEEALPYFWLAQALLNILKQAPPHEPGWNAFAPGPGNNMQGVKYGEMLKSARMFTRLGEGVVGVPSVNSTGTTTSPITSTSTSTAQTSAPGSVLGFHGPNAGGGGGGGRMTDTAGPESVNLDGIAPESIFDQATFDEFMGGYGSVNVMAN